MKAARIADFQTEVHVEEVPTPTPGLGELLIRVHACGVNPVDWKIQDGYFRGIIPQQLPLTLGCELAGVVEAVGEGVSTFVVGDSVFGYVNLVRNGAFAQYAVAHASELTRKPEGLTFVEAASLAVAPITAWEGLFTQGDLKAGEKVLVLGGSGGVGGFAVQLARQAGATVFATASSRNQDYLRSLGASVAIDYTNQNVAELAPDMDLVFDAVGGEAALEAIPCVRRGGRFVSPAYAKIEPEVALSRSFTYRPYGIQPSPKVLDQVATMAIQAKLRVALDKEYSLDQVGEALAHSRTGRARGKIVVLP